jgi:hypothetical protein
VLKKALEDRIAELGKPGSWPESLADLNSLTETEVEQDGKRFMLRSAPRPRRQPRAARRRRCPAARRPSGCRNLIPISPDHAKCSAKPLCQRGFLRVFNNLRFRTVEDQYDGEQRL